MSDLATVIASAKEEAAILRRNGHGGQADSLERFAAAVQDAAEDYLVFISESDARLRSGWSVARLRRHFAEWAEEGHAEMRGRVRYYRMLIVPTRADIAAAREAGRKGRRTA